MSAWDRIAVIAAALAGVSWLTAGFARGDNRDMAIGVLWVMVAMLIGRSAK